MARLAMSFALPFSAFGMVDDCDCMYVYLYVFMFYSGCIGIVMIYCVHVVRMIIYCVVGCIVVENTNENEK